MLALLYGCEEFHTYVYGNEFIVESDHKPLEITILKNLVSVPQRLQRMLLRLQLYKMVIKYVLRPNMYISDLLSRHPAINSTHIELINKLLTINNMKRD